MIAPNEELILAATSTGARSTRHAGAAIARPDAYGTSSRVPRRSVDGRRRGRGAARDPASCCLRRGRCRPGRPSGTVFKIERGPSGEKIAFVRDVRRERCGRAIASSSASCIETVDVHSRSSMVAPTSVAGRLRGGDRQVHGLSTARIGDTFGPAAPSLDQHTPSPRRPWRRRSSPRAVEKRAVFDALTELAEQDPYYQPAPGRHPPGAVPVALRRGPEGDRRPDARGPTTDSTIEFRPTRRCASSGPSGPGAAVELRRAARSRHPFLATVGLTISPLAARLGHHLRARRRRQVDPDPRVRQRRRVPPLMERTVDDTLRQGLHGWQVTDCHVVMTDCGYQAPPRRWPGDDAVGLPPAHPAGADGRAATAGATVFEPVLEFHLELPTPDLGPILSLLRELDARAPPGGHERLDLRARGCDPGGTVPPPASTATRADPAAKA